MTEKTLPFKNDTLKEVTQVIKTTSQKDTLVIRSPIYFPINVLINYTTRTHGSRDRSDSRENVIIDTKYVKLKKSLRSNCKLTSIIHPFLRVYEFILGQTNKTWGYGSSQVR